MAEAALEKFSADFLTERLRASGVLPCGRVIAVDAGERRSTLVSTIAPLRVEYSSDAPAEAPARMFLKPREAASILACSQSANVRWPSIGTPRR